MRSYYEEKADMLRRGACKTMNPFPLKTFRIPTNEGPEPKEVEELNSLSSLITPPMVEVSTSFGGADLVVVVDGKIIGEFTDIQWYTPSELQKRIIAMSDYYDKSVAEEYPVVIIAKQGIFAKTVPMDIENVRIIVQHANEFGQARYTQIESVSTLWTIDGTAVDDIIMEEYIVLAGKGAASYTGISPEYEKASKERNGEG